MSPRGESFQQWVLKKRCSQPPAPATISPARPNPARTASSSRDAPFTRLRSRIVQTLSDSRKSESLRGFSARQDSLQGERPTRSAVCTSPVLHSLRPSCVPFCTPVRRATWPITQNCSPISLMILCDPMGYSDEITIARIVTAFRAIRSNRG